MKTDLTSLIQRIGEHLVARGLRLTTAESCTGGWIAQQATSIAGSSDWFESGFVTYSNQAKERMLGVLPETLEHFGAVSEPVVEQMVTGAMARSGAQIGVSVSGIAGPAGGSVEKPVGTVWIAWQLLSNSPEAKCFHFQGDREAIRYQALVTALEGVHKLVQID